MGPSGEAVDPLYLAPCARPIGATTFLTQGVKATRTAYCLFSGQSFQKSIKPDVTPMCRNHGCSELATL